MYIQVPGYPDYLVNDEGSIVSLLFGRWKELKPGVARGYKKVGLWNDKCLLSTSVHRVVMLTFRGPSDLAVNHKNGIKGDNRLCNLEYVTGKENMRHAIATGLARVAGEGNSNAKLTDIEVAELRALKGKMFQREAAALFGIGQTQVGKLWNGKQRKCE